jgi:hypothetical protein
VTGIPAALVRVLIVLCVLASSSAVRAQSLFEFHSAFWINLHHYLHALARADTPLGEELPLQATDRERTEWQSAVDFYRSRYGKRRLVFDRMLVDIKQQLIAAESRDPLGEAVLAPEHRRVLERAAPIYRAHLWSGHDAANRRVITSLQALVNRHGPAIAARLARSYGDDWPQSLRVDVVRDAGPPGNAYTTNIPGPTHITMGADDQGLLSLELVFHEASHHWDQQLMKAVGDAATRLGLKAPPDLWHALLFYNAGRITADALAAAGVADYQLYMVRGKVFARPGWHDALRRHWPSFLAGDISRDEAVGRILRDVQAP